MERLTERKNGTAMIEGCGSNCKYGFEYCRKEDWENCKTIEDVIDKLAEYEDFEEQGRLIKIPLEAYCIVDFEVRKGFVLVETYHMSRKPLLVVRYDDNSFKSHSGYLGISVFLTKSEAEAKLKELRNITTGHLYAVAFNRGYLKAEKEVREKAIEDFANQFNVIVDEKCGTDTNNYFRKIVKEIAEQLKVGE